MLLNLSLITDILDIWPDVLGAQNNKFWDITNEINSDTYYFEYPNELTRIFLTYTNGKIYFKRETKYSAQIAKDGTLLYEKTKK